MKKPSKALAMIKRAAMPAVALLIIANFAGYAIAGSNGLLVWGDYRQSLAKRQVELQILERERDRLTHRAKLLDPRNADPDLADELIRGELGLARPDEVIVPLD
jgi:cell division protein FtsB